MKNYYDCTFIANPGLDDTQTENTIKAVEDTITKNGGNVSGIDRIGRRRLAYPIQKKHNGYYVCIEFEAEGRVIEKVDRFLTLDENIMRYLTLKLDRREVEAKRDRIAQSLIKTVQPAEEAKEESEVPAIAEARPKEAV